MIAFCVKKCNLQFIHVLEDGLLETSLSYYPQKVKIENSVYKLCLSKMEVFGKLPAQNTGRTGPG